MGITSHSETNADLLLLTPTGPLSGRKQPVGKDLTFRATAAHGTELGSTRPAGRLPQTLLVGVQSQAAERGRKEAEPATPLRPGSHCSPLQACHTEPPAS